MPIELPIYKYNESYIDNLEYFKVLKECWHSQSKGEHILMPSALVLLKRNNFFATVLDAVANKSSTMKAMELCKATINPDTIVLAFDAGIQLDKVLDLNPKERRVAKFLKSILNIKDVLINALFIANCDKSGYIDLSILTYEVDKSKIIWKEILINAENKTHDYLKASLKEVMLNDHKDFQAIVDDINKDTNLSIEEKEAELAQAAFAYLTTTGFTVFVNTEIYKEKDIVNV